MEKGYKLTVFQSNFADFCSGLSKIDCITYDPSSLRPTLRVPLSVTERVGLIIYKFAAISHFATAFSLPWNMAVLGLNRHGANLPLFDPVNGGRSSSVGALEALDEFASLVRRARPGQAYFAHILLPHYPYVVRPDCSYLPWRDWEYRRSQTDISGRRHAYYNQLRCTMRRVSNVLAALSKSPAGAASIVIVHGDHGSRITNVDPNEADVGKFTDADMIAGFSTLFAIRAPGIDPAYSDEPMSVAKLLQDFAQSNFRRPPRPIMLQNPTVHLDDSEWKVGRQYPLPRDWVRGAMGRSLN
jgi:hypothetical protein